MNVVGYILFGLGFILGLGGDVIILTAAFHRGTVLFIVCLFLPCAAYAFALANIRKLWLPLTLSVTGCFIAFAGFRLCGAGALMERFLE